MLAAAPPDLPESSPTLAIVRGPRRGTVLPVVLPETLVGRLDSNAIALDDASVSRIHARLTRAGHGVTLEDVGSRTGTFVNGRRLDGPVLLHDGDEVTVGDIAFVFSDVARAA